MTTRKFIFLFAVFALAQSTDQLSIDDDKELIKVDKFLNQPIIDDEHCDFYTDYLGFISDNFYKKNYEVNLISMQERGVGNKFQIMNKIIDYFGTTGWTI